MSSTPTKAGSPDTGQKAAKRPKVVHHQASIGSATTVAQVRGVRIVHIDVSQGESTLILYGTKDTIDYAALIDGGRSKYAQHIADTLTAYGVTRLDAIINTHFDADHIEGLTSLLENKHLAGITVGAIYDRGATGINDDKPRKFKQAVADFTGNEPTPISVKTLCTLGKFSLECVYVNNDLCRPAQENEASIMMMLQFGAFTYFTAGDQGDAMERKHARPSMAFKCGHHGSKHSTSSTFLEKIKPTIAVISAGPHSYCHPDIQVLENLHSCEHVVGIYLTNCSYNRPQVNPDYLKQERILFRKYVKAIEEAAEIDSCKADAALDDFAAIVADGKKFLDDEEWEDYCKLITGRYKMFKKKLAELAQKKKEKKKPVVQEQGSRKKALRDAFKSAATSAGIYLGQLDDDEDIKAVVAGNDTHLGNIEINVGENYCKVGYVDGGGDVQWDTYKISSREQVQTKIRPSYKIVNRTHAEDDDFSLITGASGEAREAIPDTPRQSAANRSIRERHERDVASMQSYSKKRKRQVCAGCGADFGHFDTPAFRGGQPYHERCAP